MQSGSARSGPNSIDYRLTMKVNWRGVFPAITTQFHADQSLNLEGTARHLEAMISAGIHGVVFLGTVGENTALDYQERCV